MMQGDIWLAEFPGKVRPVLVITRNSALNVIRHVTVAPITSTIRELPSHLKLGPAEGLHHDCAANFDDLHTLPKSGRVSERSARRSTLLPTAERVATTGKQTCRRNRCVVWFQTSC
jgi:mRNA interferase MazF